MRRSVLPGVWLGLLWRHRSEQYFTGVDTALVVCGFRAPLNGRCKHVMRIGRGLNGKDVCLNGKMQAETRDRSRVCQAEMQGMERKAPNSLDVYTRRCGIQLSVLSLMSSGWTGINKAL